MTRLNCEYNPETQEILYKAISRFSGCANPESNDSIRKPLPPNEGILLNLAISIEPTGFLFLRGVRMGIVEQVVDNYDDINHIKLQQKLIKKELQDLRLDMINMQEQLNELSRCNQI